MKSRETTRHTRSLSRTFLVRLLCILMLGQVVSLGWSLYANEQIQKADIREKLALSGKQLASLASVSRSSFDFTYLGQLIDELIKDEDTLRITYIDKGLTIIDRREGAYAGDVSKLEVPVHDGAEPVGKVVFEYTDYRVVKNVVRQATTSVAITAVIFVLLALFVRYFFNRDIGSKVVDISDTLGRISKGDLTVKAGAATDDEFGAISNGLELLTGWLSTTIERYQVISGHVAEATALLNKTFKDLINGVNRQQLSTQNAMDSVQSAIDSMEHVIHSTENLLELSEESTSALNGILAASQGVLEKMDRLSSSVNSSYKSVLAISSSSKDVAASAAKADSSMAIADTAVADINLSVSRIGEYARQTAELSRATDSIIAERGIQSVKESLDSMQRIERLVAALSLTIANLGKRSKDIAKILDVINEVTDQTKLLSLNAQILSGQAGEYGRPFAVVAGEMKSLSDKTAVSTREIEEIVSAIQGEISAAVKSAGDTATMVVEGKGVATRVNDALHLIRESSERSSDMVRGIEQVASDQSRSLEQITATFAEIRRLISEVNRTTRQEDEGLTSLVESFGVIRNAMEVTRSGSEEQCRSIQLISENFSLANEKTRTISEVSNHQREVSEEMMKAMKRIIQIGAETVNGVKDVSARIIAMNGEVESLTREMKSFKTR